MKKKSLDRYFLVLFVFAAAIVAAYYGIERIFNVDFVCTNGDYQNYNVLRRFLDGQVPYKDFANYLGMQILVLCAPLLSLKNNLAGSMFVTNMVATFLFMVFVALIFYLVTGKKSISAFAGLLMPKLLSSGIIESFIPVYGYYTFVYLDLLAHPKNSFRIGRISLAVIICLIALAYVNKKGKDKSGSVLREAAATKKGAAVMGFIGGMGITWSNDMGFCCIGAIFLVMLILTLADIFQKTEAELIWKRFIYFFAGLFIGAFISIFIATKGHMGSWFEFTLGVGDWQYFYYGRRYWDKASSSIIGIFTSPDLRRTRLHFIIFMALMLSCLYKLCKKIENDRTILYVFLFVSVFASHMLYIIGSGSDGFPEGTYSVVILTFWALVAKVAYTAASRFNLEKLFKTGMVAVTVLYVAFMSYSDVKLVKEYKAMNFTQHENYVAELGGITEYATALREMNELVGDGTLFSTYATALEDIRGEYQPTGNDYSIHAIGDERYAEYAQHFRDNTYDWVQTTNYDIWPWEIWTSKASWELYREIYSDYALNSKHSYWTMWKYAGEDVNVVDSRATVKVEPIDEGNVVISVECEETRPCWVEVEVTWYTERLDNFDGLMVLRPLIYVEDVDARLSSSEATAGYFLRKEGTRKIPVYAENGKGLVTLKVVPENSLSLTVENAEVTEIILKQK